MKTNVSIKFNSIEEYREIEKKLEELGYKCIMDIEHANKYDYCSLVNIDNFSKRFRFGKFPLDFDNIYNSLEEFLKDYGMEIHNIYTDLCKIKYDERVSLHEYLKRFKRPEDEIDDLYYFCIHNYLYLNLQFIWQIDRDKDNLGDRKEVNFNLFMKEVVKFIDSYIDKYDYSFLRC